MGALVGFPASRAAAPSLARLKCEECGGLPMIFVPCAAGSEARGAILVLHAYCSPDCAAGCGVEPWASADLVDRAGWQSREQMGAA